MPAGDVGRRLVLGARVAGAAQDRLLPAPHQRRLPARRSTRSPSRPRSRTRSAAGRRHRLRRRAAPRQRHRLLPGAHARRRDPAARQDVLLRLLRGRTCAPDPGRRRGRAALGLVDDLRFTRALHRPAGQVLASPGPFSLSRRVKNEAYADAGRPGHGLRARAQPRGAGAGRGRRRGAAGRRAVPGRLPGARRPGRQRASTPSSKASSATARRAPSTSATATATPARSGKATTTSSSRRSSRPTSTSSCSSSRARATTTSTCSSATRLPVLARPGRDRRQEPGGRDGRTWSPRRVKMALRGAAAGPRHGQPGLRPAPPAERGRSRQARGSHEGHGGGTQRGHRQVRRVNHQRTRLNRQFDPSSLRAIASRCNARPALIDANETPSFTSRRLSQAVQRGQGRYAFADIALGRRVGSGCNAPRGIDRPPGHNETPSHAAGDHPARKPRHRAIRA